MISAFILFLLGFWFIRDIKYILFWVYLWQLKQYHTGRFFSHFNTEQGQKLIFNPVLISKGLLVFVWVLSAIPIFEAVSLILVPLLFLIYFGEAAIYAKAVVYKKIKIPKFTKKTAVLSGASFLVAFVFAIGLALLLKTTYWLGFSLLFFDILIPVIVSAVVLAFQPLADYYRLSLQDKAKAKINELKKKLTIIAVTGSYGKTSTKEYLRTILASKFRVLATADHRNTEVGIPLTILNDLTADHEILIAEIGAYDQGTIKRTCEFLQPKIGLVTGVNEQHLSLFGSMDNLLSAEGGRELLDCLPANGFLAVNGENKYCRDLYSSAKIDKLAYSFDQLKNVIVETSSISFSFENKNFRLNILGKHNMLNLLGAIQVAMKIGMTIDEVLHTVQKIDMKQNSYKLYRGTSGKEGITIIDSTYSANPDGVIADLEYLKLFQGKKIIVMPCLIELGEAGESVHAKIGKKISEICDLGIVTTKEYCKELRGDSKNILCLDEPALVLEKLRGYYSSDVTVLLEGRLQEGLAEKIKKDAGASYVEEK